MSFERLESSNSGIGSPYPGLRPFQEDDAEYFFGRDSQTKEIITRLKDNRFVAVIGGSGSGKSSLILAGAIPKLRSCAIRDSGDFWVPVVTTPGTNHIEGDSPIKRLAKKFCSVLKELAPDEEQKRLEFCAALLRQHNGLDQLVKTYGRDLKNTDGVDLSLKVHSQTENNDRIAGAGEEDSLDQPFVVKVNFLFLIDQFEELFHPSNVAVADDCRHLIERIVEHFKSFGKGKSRVCVAITMRSEHLNDCPRYPELPDAINAAAYLVKRLNEAELREAIERPAKGFLRRQFQKACLDARNEGRTLPDEDDWPDDIPFDPVIVDRLLRDAEQVVAKQDHADHLPMLQHILYWIWDCAMRRSEHQGRSFPDAIIAEDFFAAMDHTGQTKELNENLNSLTCCLEYRCEWIFNRFPDRNKAWEEIFRNLAFKEPNTGTYTQRRASMAALCKNSVIGLSNKDELKQCLMPWLGPHQYLFWDESSQTVKVTHESLIRRWKRFREWADLDDRQFQEYLQILEGCTQWLENGKQDKDLIEGVALRRIEDNKLSAALKNDIIRIRFNNLLRMHRDQSRLKRGLESALEFLNRSFNKRQNKWLMKKLIFLIVPMTLTACCVGIYLWIGSQVDAQQRTLLRSYGIAAETQFALPLNGSVDKLEELQFPLSNLLDAVFLYDKGQKKLDFPFLTLLYRKKLDETHKFEILSVSRTISGLRKALLGNAWAYEPVAEKFSIIKKALPSPCRLQWSNDNKNRIVIENKKVEFYTSAERHGYGLIVLMDLHDFNTQVFWGTKEDDKCKTSFQQLIYSSAPNAKLGFDAIQRSIVVSSNKRISIFSIEWPNDGNPITGQPLPTFPRLTYNNPTNVNDKNFLQLDGTELHVSLPTITEEFSQGIQVGKHWFRIFDAYPVLTRMEPTKSIAAYKDESIAMNWKPLAESQNTSLAAWGQQKSASDYLYLIINSRDKTGTYFGDLYRVRDRDIQDLKDQKPIPIMKDIALGSKPPSEIRFDLENGYILSKSGDVWLKQLWSVAAWAKLAKDVFKEDHLEVLKNKVNEPGYLRANWLFEGEENPGHWQRMVEKVFNSISIPPAKATVEKERA